MELLSESFPPLEEVEDLPVFESEDFEEVLVPDLAFVPVDLLSEEVDLLLLFAVGLELEDDDPMPELPWLMESILEPLWFEPLWLEPLRLEPLRLDPLWFELPDDELPDMLPDWLDD